MRLKTILFFLFCLTIAFSSCVSKKKFTALESELELSKMNLRQSEQQLGSTTKRLTECEEARKLSQNSLQLREEQINDLKDQLADLRSQRDKQVEQVGDLTVLSQSANENVKETLSQLEKKDEYILLLQAAKNKADSINLALAVNLKSQLSDGIADDDVNIKVDKTVVMINLSDKMLYQSGSSKLTSRAKEVLGKIATIIESRPELDVMIEGYTDNVPIKTSCLDDNWDLSVMRATSVVRVLQNDYNIDPNRLIAAGRGQFNTLVSNDTAEGRATNRRTRIIIMPKINEFYDLLNPEKVPD